MAHPNEELVAHVVAQAIVYGLKTVEIYKEHGNAPPIPRKARDSVFETL